MANERFIISRQAWLGGKWVDVTHCWSAECAVDVLNKHGRSIPREYVEAVYAEEPITINRRAPAPVSDKGEGPRRCPSCGATNIVLSSGWWVCRPCGARWEATPPCDAGARCDQAEFFQCHLPKGHDGFCRAPLGSILGGGEDDGRVLKCNRCDGDGLVECGECGGSGFYNSDHPPHQPPADAALSEVIEQCRDVVPDASRLLPILAAFAERVRIEEQEACARALERNQEPGSEARTLADAVRIVRSLTRAGSGHG